MSMLDVVSMRKERTVAARAFRPNETCFFFMIFDRRHDLNRGDKITKGTRAMVVSIFHEVSDVRLRGLSFHRTRKQASDKWLECAKLRHGDFF